MKRFSTWMVMVAVMGLFACTGTMANADVVVDISGTFGSFGYGNQPAPLNDGSFSGSVTFSSLPGPNTTVISGTADVNFYDSTANLVFSVGGSGSYDTFTAGSSGYTTLTVSGYGTAGGSSVDVADLSLEFSNWTFGSNTGTVKPYGPPNYASSIEYTYTPGNTTYFNPVLSGQGSVPEPSTIALSLFGIVGVFVYARHNRRTATA
jgi:PEP-CTERM motif